MPRRATPPSAAKLRVCVRIPVNVTADSGNVTGIPANVTEGRCCAF
jgi:hypothetical protein